MKALTRYRYGGPEVLKLEDAEMPALEDDQVLVKTMANSVNPADWHILRGKPFFARLTYGLFKPKQKIIGADFSGIVEKAGKNVGRLRVGDRVFGATLDGGVFAEYISVSATACTLMPDAIDFADMACMPVAGLTALQALTTHGQLNRGESVLINGAAGGVGHFAVQIAKSLGANVTAVCSAKNADFVRALGADTIIPYDLKNVHQHEGRYDLVVDVFGNLSYGDYKRMGRRGVMVGFTTMEHMAKLVLKAKVGKFPLEQFTVDINCTDLDTLANLMRSGHIKPYIEKKYGYVEIPEAIAYIEIMHTKGKVGITWGENDCLHEIN